MRLAFCGWRIPAHLSDRSNTLASIYHTSSLYYTRIITFRCSFKNNEFSFYLYPSSCSSNARATPFYVFVLRFEPIYTYNLCCRAFAALNRPTRSEEHCERRIVVTFCFKRTSPVLPDTRSSCFANYEEEYISSIFFFLNARGEGKKYLNH